MDNNDSAALGVYDTRFRGFSRIITVIHQAFPSVEMEQRIPNSGKCLCKAYFAALRLLHFPYSEERESGGALN